MSGRTMHVRMPAETPVAVKNDRQRKRVRSLFDWKVATPAERAQAALDAKARTVVLVGCGKAKSAEAGPACELYTSPLFRKSLELAELVGDAVYIASAAKVLVGLDDRITPYERSLRSWPKWARDEWGENVLSELEANTLGSPARLRVVLLMGCTYADPILAAVRRQAAKSDRWAAPIDLLRGLQIGDRLSFLNLAITTVAQGGSVRGLQRRRTLDVRPPRL